ncbi:hypothetical protein M0R45_016920 [Rubus argutus]|uniref:Uncharacterized protein n=1 Tax=Rubus argutus TaxID=59490 RepID=A0AAW1XU00_RUBAR
MAGLLRGRRRWIECPETSTGSVNDGVVWVIGMLTVVGLMVDGGSEVQQGNGREGVDLGDEGDAYEEGKGKWW